MSARVPVQGDYDVTAMGMTIWVDVEDVPHAKTDTRDHSIVLVLEKNLERVATKLGVKKLKEFYDYSSMAAAYADRPVVIEPRWADPSELLASLEAIHEHLRAHPKALRFRPDVARAHYPGSLMAELEHCVSVVKRARTERRRVRLLVLE